MRRTLLITAIAAGAIAMVPAMAQQSRGAEAAPGREETVPLQLTAGQVAQMQQKLNEQGLSAGRTDGLWGPDTSAAVTRFQEKNGLRASGQLDQDTLRALGMVDAAPAATLPQGTASPAPASPPDTAGTRPATAADRAQSQAPQLDGTPAIAAGRAADRVLGTDTTGTSPGANAPDGTAGNPPGTTVGRAMDSVQGQTSQPDGTPGNPPGTAAGRAADRTLGTNATGTNPGGTAGSSQAAAGGDTNQAVATTSANAPQPAKGANSFTDGEARRRIEGNGYSTVADLRKDDDGIWRGSATKDGAKVNVWLDYKGNVGQQ